MAKKSGSDTNNVCIALLRSEQLILGKLAMAEDRSLSDFIRRTLIVGLRTANPKAANEMEEVRQVYKEQMLLNLK